MNYSIFRFSSKQIIVITILDNIVSSFERQSVVSSEVSQYHIKTNYKHKILIEACQNFNFLIWNFCKTCLDCFNCLTLWNNTNINSETFCRNVYFLKLYSNRSANRNPINQTINLQVVIKKWFIAMHFNYSNTWWSVKTDKESGELQLLILILAFTKLFWLMVICRHHGDIKVKSDWFLWEHSLHTLLSFTKTTSNKGRTAAFSHIPTQLPYSVRNKGRRFDFKNENIFPLLK